MLEPLRSPPKKGVLLGVYDDEDEEQWRLRTYNGIKFETTFSIKVRLGNKQNIERCSVVSIVVRWHKIATQPFSSNLSFSAIVYSATWHPSDAELFCAALPEYKKKIFFIICYRICIALNKIDFSYHLEIFFFKICHWFSQINICIHCFIFLFIFFSF